MANRDNKAPRHEQPRVFFSYARDDADLVKLIAEFLAPLPIPVFIDTKSIVPGEKWEDRIVDELDKATHVYVFWSKYAAASEWVAVETELAIDDGKVVIPVRIDDTVMPKYLSALMGIDVRFVAGVNRARYDKGLTESYVDKGKSLLTQFGVTIEQLLVGQWEKQGKLRPDGCLETDPRLVAIALYGILGYCVNGA